MTLDGGPCQVRGRRGEKLDLIHVVSDRGIGRECDDVDHVFALIELDAAEICRVEVTFTFLCGACGGIVSGMRGTSRQVFAIDDNGHLIGKYGHFVVRGGCDKEGDGHVGVSGDREGEDLSIAALEALHKDAVAFHGFPCSVDHIWFVACGIVPFAVFGLKHKGLKSRSALIGLCVFRATHIHALAADGAIDVAFCCLFDGLLVVADGAFVADKGMCGFVLLLGVVAAGRRVPMGVFIVRPCRCEGVRVGTLIVAGGALVADKGVLCLRGALGRMLAGRLVPMVVSVALPGRCESVCMLGGGSYRMRRSR